MNDVGWYGSSYLLTSTALQPCFGKIYAHFDIKIVYLTSVLIFEGLLLDTLVGRYNSTDKSSSWFRNLRHCKKFSNVYRRTCYRWFGCGCTIFRVNDHSGLFNPLGKTAVIHWGALEYVWAFCGCWSFTRRFVCLSLITRYYAFLVSRKVYLRIDYPGDGISVYHYELGER